MRNLGENYKCRSIVSLVVPHSDNIDLRDETEKFRKLLIHFGIREVSTLLEERGSGNHCEAKLQGVGIVPADLLRSDFLEQVKTVFPSAASSLSIKTNLPKSEHAH